MPISLSLPVLILAGGLTGFPGPPKGLRLRHPPPAADAAEPRSVFVLADLDYAKGVYYFLYDPNLDALRIDNIDIALYLDDDDYGESDVEVAFTLGRAGPVDLVVYDVAGREVRAVARGTRLETGAQSLRWDGRDANGREAGAGVYFVRLKTERATWTRAVVRVR